MKRATHLLAPLLLLSVGLGACRRVTWQIVAEPQPERESTVVLENTAPTPGEIRPLGLAADPADARVREGHLVGNPAVRATGAGAQSEH